MKLRLQELLFFLALGVTGTTEYFTDAPPFVWGSPVWFPAIVALATLPWRNCGSTSPPRAPMSQSDRAWPALPAVLGTYVTTALVYTAATVPATVLIATMATITWYALGDGPTVVCGMVAAIIRPIVETVLVKVEVFAYDEACDDLFGVAPWLVPLYFAFGVVVALLAEIAANRSR